MSVELLQMRGECDDKLKLWGNHIQIHLSGDISIQIMEQCKKMESLNKQFSVKRHLCCCCFSHPCLHEDHRVCQSMNIPISDDKFIDHRSAEQLMAFNDTIVLKISLLH